MPNMTEAKRIKTRLEQKGRVAYRTAKRNDNAYIVMGNSIYRMSADGERHKVEELSTTRVKAKQKRFVIK